MKGPDLRFSLADPKIFDVTATRRPAPDDYHIMWHATYEEEPKNRSRLVVATLYVSDEDAELTITAGSVFVASSRSALAARDEELANIVGSSLALETLYDVVRMHARTLMGMLRIELDLPSAAPDAEVSAFKDEGEETDSDEASEVSPSD
ncbi:hypothetical protein MUG94_14145 [Arthrobacter gengyunqii]|uniref:Uncharacterized protein n=1 Tax=Arthrobacter gengyunqii TaxID=2886940 RepID=A0A9X1S4H0_9MICC|nr:hypothetical protein [Arthrobacter gengyunqii]MCC3268255.1 hypothetical protein [Arthrobacter gengyunqii]UOY95662.1 hypothetical protein MUG94_14145 [Arthrobacter gengyunqii]